MRWLMTLLVVIGSLVIAGAAGAEQTYPARCGAGREARRELRARGRAAGDQAGFGSGASDDVPPAACWGAARQAAAEPPGPLTGRGAQRAPDRAARWFDAAAQAWVGAGPARRAIRDRTARAAVEGPGARTARDGGHAAQPAADGCCAADPTAGIRARATAGCRAGTACAGLPAGATHPGRDPARANSRDAVARGGPTRSRTRRTGSGGAGPTQRCACACQACTDHSGAAHCAPRTACRGRLRCGRVAAGVGCAGLGRGVG